MIPTPASATLLLVIALSAHAQQPNAGAHSMTINGIDGPPYPIATNDVRTSSIATFAMRAPANQPYAIYQSGALAIGTTTAFGGSVDLALTPAPTLPIDGFANPAYRTDATGNGGFGVQVPDAGVPPVGVPIGLQLALQAVVADPFSPYGLSNTAATRVTVVQGPIVTYYSLGDELEQHVSFPTTMQIPFYGNSYTGLFIGSNGYVCFGTSLGSDPTSSPQDMLSGPPRIAAQWCDLACPADAVRTTIDTNPGPGQPGYVRIDYIGVPDWLIPISHDLSILIRTDGYVEISSAATNNAAHFDQMTGIAPGYGFGGLNQPQRNFYGPQPAGSAVGSGILTTPPYAYVGGVNEAFYEWYGIVSQNLAYLQSYDNPYDLIGITLHFQTTGSGGLPGSSNRYVVY
jgi:hypothetical protein